jgi:hypothetical protein
MPPSPWMVSRNTATTLGLLRHRLDRGQVVHRHAHEAFDQRAEAGLHLGVAGGRQRGDRAAVEGLLVDDDLGALDALVVAELARDLQRRLVGLEPGAAEETPSRPESSHSLAASAPAAAPRSSCCSGSACDLVLQRRHQLRVVVAQRVDGDAAQAVEVALAVGCPRPSSPGRATARSAGGRRCSSRAASGSQRTGFRGVHAVLSRRHQEKAGAQPFGHRRPGANSKGGAPGAEKRRRLPEPTSCMLRRNNSEAQCRLRNGRFRQAPETCACYNRRPTPTRPADATDDSFHRASSTSRA